MVKFRTRSRERQEQRFPCPTPLQGQSQFLSRPFGFQSPATGPKQPNLPMALAKAQHFGHHPSKVSVLSPDRFPQPTGNPLQAKFSIGKPQDRYEQQADKQADQVMAHLNDSLNLGEELTPRKRRRDEDSGLSPITAQEVQPLMQTQTATQDADHQEGSLESRIAEAQGGGEALSENIRRPMERSFGANFEQVRVHTDARSHQMNRSLNARAFTTQQNIFFRQGEYNPGSRSGQKLLAHELTHVIQQTGGGRSGPQSVQPKLIQCDYLTEGSQWKAATTAKKMGIEVSRRKLQQVDLLLAQYQMITAPAQKQMVLQQLLAALNQVNYLTVTKNSKVFNKRKQACEQLKQEIVKTLKPNKAPQTPISSPPQTTPWKPGVISETAKAGRQQTVNTPVNTPSFYYSNPTPESTSNPLRDSNLTYYTSQPQAQQLESYNTYLPVSGDLTPQPEATTPTPSTPQPQVPNTNNSLRDSNFSYYTSQSQSQDLTYYNTYLPVSGSYTPEPEASTLTPQADHVPTTTPDSPSTTANVPAKSITELDTNAAKANKEVIKYHLLKSMDNFYKENQAEGRAAEKDDSTRFVFGKVFRGVSPEEFLAKPVNEKITALQSIGWSQAEIDGFLKTQKTQVKYLETEESRADYELQGGSTLTQGRPPQPFDTTQMFANGVGQGHGIFVLSPNGQLFASAHKIGLFHHSSFLAGLDTAAAGTMKVEKGQLKEISNKTGHYMAGEEQLTQALMELEERGTSLSGVKVKLSNGHYLVDYSGDARKFLDENKSVVKAKNDQIQKDEATLGQWKDSKADIEAMHFTFKNSQWHDWDDRPVPDDVIQALLDLGGAEALKDTGFTWDGDEWFNPDDDTCFGAHDLLGELKDALANHDDSNEPEEPQIPTEQLKEELQKLSNGDPKKALEAAGVEFRYGYFQVSSDDGSISTQLSLLDQVKLLKGEISLTDLKPDNINFF